MEKIYKQYLLKLFYKESLGLDQLKQVQEKIVNILNNEKIEITHINDAEKISFAYLVKKNKQSYMQDIYFKICHTFKLQKLLSENQRKIGLISEIIRLKLYNL